MKYTIGDLVRLKEDKGHHKAGEHFQVLWCIHDYSESMYRMKKLSDGDLVSWWEWRVEPVEERSLEEQIAELLG